MSEQQTIAQLTTTTQTTSWIPSREYAALIVQKAQASRLLRGVAAAVEHKVDQGEGTVVRVRIFPKRTAQGPISENGALTATNSSPTYADITIQKYGDRDTLSGESIYQTKGPLKAKILEAMARGVARKYDELVYDALHDATPGSSKTLATAGDLTTNSDFAVKLMELVDEMRAGKDVVPDVVLLGPDQINALARISQNDLQVGSAIQIDASGRVNSFYGLRVMDLFSIANRNAATLSLVQAIVIDSSRAFGEADGKPLTFEEDRLPTTDQYEEVCWSWFGTAVIDTDGIGHLKNPAS